MKQLFLKNLKIPNLLLNQEALALSILQPMIH